jgi:transposase
MFERDMAAAAERERLAMLDKYVLAAAAYRAGMTTREIGAVFGIRSSTATQWKDWGEQETQRRTASAPEAAE